MLNLVKMAEADGVTELVEFSDRGFSGQTLTKGKLGGTTLATAQIFSDEDSVIVTIYFMNHLPKNLRYQTYGEFNSQRHCFIRDYIQCVAKEKSTPIHQPR